ncbi:YiaA/YiaB family inner membrane protein [Nostoc sp.]|uniref:YiaA/YiaB family inner membrane protein n=1 Tax=Nostoc sp. TaxID=1180 RepID=UPI002FF73B89
MQTIGTQKDSPAWVIQTWAAFILSISMTTFGIVNLPVDGWVKGFMGMGLAFSVGSTFTLAKTTRDLHETRRLTARLDEAKVEKLLSQHDPLNFK